MLALRMVTEKDLYFCTKIYEKLNNPDKSYDNKNDKTLLMETNMSKSAKRRLRKKKLNESLAHEAECDKSESIVIDSRAYELVSHDSIRSASDFFERSLMAVFLLKCLQTVNFFKKPSTLISGTPYKN